MANNYTQQATSTTVNLMPGSTALTIVFVLLKVFDKIDWSWWWVFAPMWLPLAVVFGVVGVALALYLLALGALEVVDWFYRRNRKSRR